MGPRLLIFLTILIDLLGFGIVIPLLPVYAKAFDASEATLGLLFASFSGMQFLFAQFWGRLSDKIGRRPVLIGGLVGTSVAYVLFANAHTLGMVFASRILAGFFGANIATAQAYMADTSAPEDRAKAMGMIGAAFGIGFTLGPPIGGELSYYWMPAPGYAAAALSLCAAIFGWFNLPEPKAHKGSRVFGLGQVRVASTEPRIGTVFVLNFLAIAAFSCFEAMFVVFGLASFPGYFGSDAAVVDPSLEQRLAAGRYAGRYLGFIGIISAVIQGGFIRRLVPRFGETKLAIAGPALLCLSMAIVAIAPSWWVVMVGCIVMPLGFGMNNPSLSSLASRASPDAEQGAFLGLFQSLSSLARTIAPPLAGVIFGSVGPSGPFWFAAGLVALATWIAAGYHRRYGATFPRSAKPA